VPSLGDTVELRVRDAGSRVTITLNEFAVDMPPLIPIFTDFYLHLHKSSWAELEEIEVGYFEREELLNGACSCSNRCTIF